MKTRSLIHLALAFVFFFTLKVRADGASDAAAADNRFGFELLNQCGRSFPQKNLFLSPPSLALALEMVQNGAKGATEHEMSAMLHTSGSMSAVNENNKSLLNRLASLDPKIDLEIANALWVSQKAVLKPDFVSVNKTFYHAQVANADFSDPATVQAINRWVSDHTHGKITTIIDQLDPMLRLIVLDAIYFKGDWTTPFLTNETQLRPFTRANGQTITHPRMRRTGKFDYVEEADFQAVSLPYSEGDLCMDIVLPKGTLDDLLHTFSLDRFEAALSHLQSTPGTVEMPRFKLENEYDLNPVLESMGTRLAFTPQADLSGLSSEPLHISWIKQKTYVDVNEQGTVAAAVTGIAAGAMAVREEPPPFRMIIDRPFLVAIRERQTGLILFLGVISDPR